MKHPHQIETAFASIADDELAHVVGGARARHHAAPPSSNLFGFLDAPYKKLVFNVAGDIGGGKLAEKMYGSRMTASDSARSKAAMKQFLIAGNKLPQGVPNLFG